MTKKFHLAFVSNAQAAAQVVQTLAPSMGIDIDIYVAAMEQAVGVSKSLFEKGVEVIIGCGSTGRMLQDCLDGPVVTVSNIPLAVLRALQKAKKYANTIALPYYEAIPEWLNVLAGAMDMKLIPVIFHDTQSLVTCTSNIVARGIDCVVGSNIAVQVAKAQGCHGVEVFYSEQEIRLGLEEALRLARVLEKRDVQTALLASVAEDITDRGVVCCNEGEKTLVLNARARQLLRCSRPEQKYLRKRFSDFGLLKPMQAGERRDSLVFDVKKDRLCARVAPVSRNGRVCGSVTLLQRLGEGDERRNGVNFKSRYTFNDIAGQSACIRDLRGQAALYARTDASLLIQGETGTGKELLAHSIHDASLRRAAPFVALNCAALPETLLESELFGYEEGAFTGAKRGGKDGIFAMADGGTVFLDEIADISPTVQVRLLRVLEAKEVMRVGGDRIIPINVRVISSSWKKLGNEVRKGRFRADLYYRLSVLALTLPPLRDRTEDIPAIVAAILRRRGMESKRLSPRAYELLARHVWPGNIRELDILLQRYCLLLRSDGPDDVLLEMLLSEMMRESQEMAPDPSASALPGAPLSTPAPQALPAASPPTQTTLRDAAGATLRERLEDCEREIIRDSLAAHQHNRANTAKSLGISPNTLWRKMNALL